MYDKGMIDQRMGYVGLQLCVEYMTVIESNSSSHDNLIGKIMDYMSF